MTNGTQTIPIEGATRLTLEISGADVFVRWVDGSSIKVSGAHLPIDRAGDEIFIRADVSRRRSEDEGDDAEIRISGFESPSQAVEEILFRTGLFSGFGKARKGTPLAVEIPRAIVRSALEVEQGDLSLDQPHGSVECKLKRGNFSSTGGNAELEVSAGSGEVQLTGLAGSIRAVGGSGDITLTDVEAITNVKAGSGEITLLRVSGEAIKLTAGSGDIYVRDSRSSAYSSDCGSGDVFIEHGRLERITVRTGSGDVRCTAYFGPHGQSFVTGSGSVSLGVPRDVSARIEAFTSSGDIDTELPLVSVGQRGPRSRRSNRRVGSVGSGEPRAEVSVRTASGDIRVHWLQPVPNEAIPMPPPLQDVPQPPMPPKPPTPPAAPSMTQNPTASSSRSEDTSQDESQAVLESLARGEITVDEADELLNSIEVRKSSR